MQPIGAYLQWNYYIFFSGNEKKTSEKDLRTDQQYYYILEQYNGFKCSYFALPTIQINMYIFFLNKIICKTW